MTINLAMRCVCVVLLSALTGLAYSGASIAQEADYPGVAKGDKFLAAGPRPATLTVLVKKIGAAKVTPEEREIELLLLTEQSLLYRVKAKGASAKIERVPSTAANAPKVASVSMVDPQTKKTLRWEFDAGMNKYTGPVRAPELVAIKPSADFTSQETNHFLFFTYQWLVDQLEDTVRFDEPETAKALIKRAERTEETIAKLGLDSRVGTLYGNMKPHYATLLETRSDLEKTLTGAASASARLREIRENIETERRWLAATQASVVGLNFLSLMMGGEGSLAPDPFILRHGLYNLHWKMQADIVESQLQQETRTRVGELVKQFNGKIALRKERDKAVAKKLGLPYIDWYAERFGEIASKKDWPKLVERFTEIQSEIKKSAPHGDPWLQLEIYHTQTLVNFTRFDNEKLLNEKIQQNAAERNKLASEIFDITEHTPPHKAFKEYRGDLLFRAAECSLLAAELELGDKASLRNAYSPKAVHTLRVLNLARNYDLEDVNRAVSEVRFRAMAHSQLHREALDFGSQFSGTRDTAKYHLTMARLHLLYATDTKLEASKEYTKKAIKAGFYDFHALQSNPDLKKVLSPDFVAENMTAEVTVRIDADKKGKIKAFILTNHSPFAIFNGSFSVGKVQGFTKTPYGPYPIVAKTNYKTIDFLRPRASMVIPDSSNVNGQFFYQQNSLYGFLVTNQGNSGVPVRVKLDK